MFQNSLNFPRAGLFLVAPIYKNWPRSFSELNLDFKGNCYFWPVGLTQIELFASSDADWISDLTTDKSPDSLFSSANLT